MRKGQMELVPLLLALMVAGIIGIAVVMPVIQTQINTASATSSNTQTSVNSSDAYVLTLAYGDLVANSFSAASTHYTAVTNESITFTTNDTYYAFAHNPVTTFTALYYDADNTQVIDSAYYDSNTTAIKIYANSSVSGYPNVTAGDTYYAAYTYGTPVTLTSGNYTVDVGDANDLATVTWSTGGLYNSSDVTYSYYPSTYIKNRTVVTLMQLMPLFLALILMIAAIGLVKMKGM